MKRVLSLALAGAVALAASATAFATNTVVDIYNSAAGGGTATVFTITSATVTSVLGHYSTNTGYCFTLQDSTGSVLAFEISTANCYSGGIAGYLPQVGDQVSFTAKNSPYQGGPELTNTSCTLDLISSGNLVTPTLITTADMVLNGIGSLPPLAEALVTLTDVTFPAGTSTLTKTSYTVKDSLGGTGVVYPNTSYGAVLAAVTAFNGNATLSAYVAGGGAVDISGYLQDYYGTPELMPTAITATVTPEPASLGLLALGALGLLARRVRRA